MGWGTPHKNKALCLGEALRVVEAPPPAAMVLVDANAITRALMAGTTPPRLVARRFWDKVLACLAPSGRRVVGVFWDNRSRTPPCRDALHARRYSKPSPKATDAQVAALSAGSVGTSTWTELMAHPEGKAKGTRLVCEEIKREAIARAGGDSPEIFMSEPVEVGASLSAPVWTYPFDQPPLDVVDAHRETQMYGEAECQAVAVLRSLVIRAAGAGSAPMATTVLTIDTDMILQLLGIFAPRVTIAIAAVWQAPAGTVHRVRKSAPPKSKQMWEIVDVDRITAGRTGNDLLWKMFCWLAIGGVDYCKGLGSFGWPAAAVLCSVDRVPPPIWRGEGGTIHVDIAAVASAMAATRKSSRKNLPSTPGGGAAGLVAELNDMLLCVSYYACQNALRPSGGGPLVVDVVPGFVGATTVDDWLAAAVAGGGIVEMADTHPAPTVLDPGASVGAGQYLAPRI